MSLSNPPTSSLLIAANLQARRRKSQPQEHKTAPVRSRSSSSSSTSCSSLLPELFRIVGDTNQNHILDPAAGTESSSPTPTPQPEPEQEPDQQRIPSSSPSSLLEQGVLLGSPTRSSHQSSLYDTAPEHPQLYESGDLLRLSPPGSPKIIDELKQKRRDIETWLNRKGGASSTKENKTTKKQHQENSTSNRTTTKTTGNNNTSLTYLFSTLNGSSSGFFLDGLRLSSSSTRPSTTNATTTTTAMDLNSLNRLYREAVPDEEKERRNDKAANHDGGEDRQQDMETTNFSKLVDESAKEAEVSVEKTEVVQFNSFEKFCLMVCDKVLLQDEDVVVNPNLNSSLRSFQEQQETSTVPADRDDEEETRNDKAANPDGGEDRQQQEIEVVQFNTFENFCLMVCDKVLLQDEDVDHNLNSTLRSFQEQQETSTATTIKKPSASNQKKGKDKDKDGKEFKECNKKPEEGGINLNVFYGLYQNTRVVSSVDQHHSRRDAGSTIKAVASKEGNTQIEKGNDMDQPQWKHNIGSNCKKPLTTASKDAAEEEDDDDDTDAFVEEEVSVANSLVGSEYDDDDEEEEDDDDWVGEEIIQVHPSSRDESATSDLVSLGSSVGSYVDDEESEKIEEEEELEEKECKTEEEEQEGGFSKNNDNDREVYHGLLYSSYSHLMADDKHSMDLNGLNRLYQDESKRNNDQNEEDQEQKASHLLLQETSKEAQESIEYHESLLQQSCNPSDEDPYPQVDEADDEHGVNLML